MDSSFTKVPLNVPKLSGFDKSHQNLLTGKCGQILPILVDELIPGTKVSLKLALNAQLPPLASDTFMRCSVKTEAFFVPMRLLAGSFESWFTDTPQQFVDATSSLTFTEKLGWLPCIGNFDAAEAGTLASNFFGVGTLGDYLGCKFNSNSVVPPTIGPITAMPWLCYWRIIDDWYRNTLVERPVFVRPTAYVQNAGGSSATSNSSPSAILLFAGTSPYYFFSENVRTATGSGNTRQNYCFTSSASCSLSNGHYLWEIAQRNFGLDYFTTALPDKQLGNQYTVSFSTSGSTGAFTIESLRMSNAMQQFVERNQLSGVRYQDTLYQRYGSNLSSGVAQRCLFLGSADYPVYTKGVYQNSQNIDQGSSDAGVSSGTGNPFGSAGAKYGSASAVGSDLHIRFEANEPGYLMVMATLVPKVTYSSGIHRRFLHYNRAGSITDLANPILQSVGPQPIFQAELTGNIASSTSPGGIPDPTTTLGVFGYTDRYAEFKTMEDELHGIIRDGNSLQAFALQRSFTTSSTPQINSSFLKIPTNYMDQVTAVAADLSNYGYWLDTYFDYKVAMPLSKYSLPTLQDPAYEHGRTVVVTKGGSKL